MLRWIATHCKDAPRSSISTTASLRSDGAPVRGPSIRSTER